MSKITFLFDPQPEECSQYVLKSLVNLSLSILIKKVLIKKSIIQDLFHLFFPSFPSGQDNMCRALKTVLMEVIPVKDLEIIQNVAKW